MAHEKVEELLRAALQGGDGLAGLRTIAQTLSTLLAPPPLVFATPKYAKFAQRLVAGSNGRLELGKDVRKTHDDGRGWHKFTTDVKNRQVIIVGGTIDDTDWMEVYRMGYNAWFWGAKKLTILIPYHGDARQERWQEEGESVDGMYASMMLTSIPKTPDGNDIVLIDIHADAITSFFEGGGCRTFNVPALTALMDKLIQERFKGNCVLAAPDAGRGKIVQKLAETRDLGFAIASKSRSKKKVKFAGLIGNVAGQNVLLSDDMAVSCRSAIGAAELIKDAGALEIVLVCTHPVLPINPDTTKSWLYNLAESGLFSAFHVYNTIPHIEELSPEFPDFLQVESAEAVTLPYLLA